MVERVFITLNLYFATVNLNQKLKLKQSFVTLLYLPLMLMFNFHKLIYPQKGSTVLLYATAASRILRKPQVNI